MPGPALVLSLAVPVQGYVLRSVVGVLRFYRDPNVGGHIIFDQVEPGVGAICPASWVVRRDAEPIRITGRRHQLLGFDDVVLEVFSVGAKVLPLRVQPPTFPGTRDMRVPARID